MLWRRFPCCIGRASVALSLLMPFIAPDVLAQLQDAAGSKDHPMLKRYEGSVIIGYEFRKFGDFVLPTGPVKRGGPGGETKYTPTKSERIEGQTTRILYVAPEGRSTLEVMRNYEQELQQSGFEVIYRCAREECGERDGRLGENYLYPLERRLKNTPPPGSGRPEGQVSQYALAGAKEQHYLAAKRASPQGDVYASVYVATPGFQLHKETFGHPVVLLDVVETVPMETKMVTVDAATMAKEVATAGHVALYGIYFDTDKADLKPESAPTIEEIAKLLTEDPKLTMYVVGHTDNVGGYEYNIELSERRAAAVVKELTSKHGIQAARLKPAGVGPLSPVASNDAEEERAKNRRVELVKQ